MEKEHHLQSSDEELHSFSFVNEPHLLQIDSPLSSKSASQVFPFLVWQNGQILSDPSHHSQLPIHKFLEKEFSQEMQESVAFEQYFGQFSKVNSTQIQSSLNLHKEFEMHEFSHDRFSIIVIPYNFVCAASI